MVYIQLLGRPEIRLDGQILDLPRRKSRALLYYIAAHTRPLAREHLLAMFWPDTDRPAAQQTLRVVLHGLRKMLGGSLIVDKDTLGMAVEAKVDVRLFEEQLFSPSSNPEQLISTVDLYRGDFLDGFSLSDSPEFDDWLTTQRGRYRRLAVRGLLALAELHEKRGHFAEALDSLDRALAFDPLQEDLQRTYMRLLYLSGDRPGAIRHYDNLRKLLDSELGVSPMVETQALYDAIVGDALPAASIQGSAAGSLSRFRPPSSTTQSPASGLLPFVGRNAQLEMLCASTAAGTRGLILIEGEPGIGKTRLAEEFIRQANALPVVGVAHELDRSLPYQPITEALRGLLSRPDWPRLDAGLRSGLSPVWRSEIARLLPELAVSGQTHQRSSRGAEESRLWEAVNQLLLALARQQPVVGFLDDLHWAEPSTLGMLGYLIRQPSAAPILFLAASRPVAPRSPLAALLQTLTREGRVTRMTLPRLESNHVTSIASHLSSDYSYPLADWLMRTSEGNPYILAELVRYAREKGVLLPSGVVNLDILSSSPVVPQTVYSLVQSRLNRLSDGARRVLDAAVAIGREFEFELLAQVAGISEDAAIDALDELSEAGLVHTIGGSCYAFDHSLTLEVAYRELSEPRQRLLHRRVAETLESIHQNHLESVARLLAWHFKEGNSPERAAPYALLAGQQASRLAAWSEAIAFYEQALAGSAHSERLPILMALGTAHFQSGNAVQASEAFREALSLAQSRSDAAKLDAARLALGRTFLHQARYAEAIELAMEVRETGQAENAVSAEFLWGTALSLEGADLKEAASHLQAAESLCCEQLPIDRASLAQIKFELGSIAAQQGDTPRAIALYREALAAAQESEDQEAALPHLILAYNNLGYHLHLLNDLTAFEYAASGLKLAQERGLLGLKPYLLSTLGEIALSAGDLDTAEKHFTEGLSIAEQLSIRERVAGLTANLGLLALKRGQNSLAIHRLSTALASADALGTRHLAARIRLWLAPLLPVEQGRSYLAEVRAFAESGGRQVLLQEIAYLESQLN